jgi:hypothetical protein
MRQRQRDGGGWEAAAPSSMHLVFSQADILPKKSSNLLRLLASVYIYNVFCHDINVEMFSQRNSMTN